MTKALPFAYHQELSCPLLKRSGKYDPGRGLRRESVFRKINQSKLAAHHDALEFPDGKIVLLTLLKEGQRATVLQLPATLERAKAAQPSKVKV